jgi:hypothetical protein
MKNTRIVGTSVPRLEGRDKVTGQARYVDDMVLPGMLYGATVRSRIPRGEIKKFTFGPGIDWKEFVIVSPKDIPGKNCIALIEDDQPCLADGTVNHPEEPLLLLAHPDRYLLPKAVEAVSVEYHPLPAIFSIEESEGLSQIIWGTNNTFKSYLIEKGIRAYGKRDYIVEGEYRRAQEQLYIENNGMIAAFDAQQGLTVWGSLQCPYYIHKALMKLCDLPAGRVRVVQMETGGAFGGKEEYPSMIAAHAALLAMKSGKPVKIIYDRMEDMTATTKRHPSRTRHRTAKAKTAEFWVERLNSPLTAALTKLCHPWFFRVAPFMPVVPTIGPVFAFALRLWPPMHRRTARFAGLVRRSPYSHWSATWTASLRPLGFRPSKSGVQISLSLARPRQLGKLCMKGSIWAGFSTERWNSRTITQRKRNSRRKISRVPARRELALSPFCTARDSPVQASAT